MLIDKTNVYINSKLTVLYQSYDAIAPQKYAGKPESKVGRTHGAVTSLTDRH